MSQSRASKNCKRRCTRNLHETKSTQTERERPANPTATINNSVILKITDFTKLEDDGRNSVDETSISDESSHSSANSAMRRRSKALASTTNCASQTSKEWRNSNVNTSAATSVSDETELTSTSTTVSYDYLEGQRLVTSLVELPLSDNENEQQQHLKEVISKMKK